MSQEPIIKQARFYLIHILCLVSAPVCVLLGIALDLNVYSFIPAGILCSISGASALAADRTIFHLRGFQHLDASLSVGNPLRGRLARLDLIIGSVSLIGAGAWFMLFGVGALLGWSLGRSS